MVARRGSSASQYRRYRDKLAERGWREEPAPDSPTPGGGAARRHRSFLVLLGDFLGLLRGDRGPIAFALATLSVSTLLGLVPPAATKIVVDYVLIGNPVPAAIERLGLGDDRPKLLATTALAIIAVAVVSIAIGTWGRWQATRTTKRAQAALRRRVFEHAIDLPLHRVQALKSGGVASILRDDTGGIADLIFSMLYNPWRAIIQLIGTLTILTVVDWRLLLGSLAFIPLVFLTHRTWIARVRPLWRDIRTNRQLIDTHATEVFSGLRVVRAFGRHRSESGRYTRGNHLMARKELHAWWWARSVEIVWAVLIPAASAVLLWYGGGRVLAGAISAGDLVMFLAYLVMLLAPLETLAATATQLQNNLAGLDRVLDLLDEPREMPSAPGASVPDRRDVRGAISVRGVSFIYPGARSPALTDVSLEVDPGQTVALVGRSGAGKTTLCNLVARFYDPTEGAIALDGMDLRELDVVGYRRLMGIVEQDIFLFDGTVAENIGYGRRGATMDEIVAAARRAHADEFVRRLPKQYDTIIGERGVRLSGGERQRLAIARAMLADPRILILDEATSNLDAISEGYIRRSLAELMEGRTTFVIAHRLSTVVGADRIVLLESGQIVDTGTHDELLDRCESYRELVFLQLQDTTTGAAERGMT